MGILSITSLINRGIEKMKAELDRIRRLIAVDAWSLAAIMTSIFNAFMNGDLWSGSEDGAIIVWPWGDNEKADLLPREEKYNTYWRATYDSLMSWPGSATKDVDIVAAGL
ncbi:hypothetical protein L1987_85662 [Smallanthus sonchifolius]|uniref:Uncharacterized protein n=1 Tax=Smallanthus sonchifolius TaxID=185202 RepID=A0ACB8XX58_9ASTR|nr:hypothetical protein L1987_85662 [Smallanthus sonchifolius]